MSRLTGEADVSDNTRALVAAIAAAAVAGAGLSLSTPLLALRMEVAGYSGAMNGAGTSVSGVATLVFAPFVPSLAARFGLGRFVLASLLVSLVSLLAFAWTEWDLRLWFPLRGIYSCGLAGLFVTSEFVVNALAPPDRRGLWIGLYSTFLALGFAAGPLLLSVVGTAGIIPFLAGAALFAIAGAPIGLAGGKFPALLRGGPISTLAFVTRAPGLMSAAFVFGAIETGAMGLLPVHAVRNGFDAETGAFFVAMLAVGNFLFQMPLGIASDRIPRRMMLLAIALIATSGALLLATMTKSAAFVPALAVWSGITSGLYMVGLAELGARYRGGDLAGANAAFVSCYALGMVVGPPLAGRVVDAAPTDGLFLALGALAAVTLIVQVLHWHHASR